jgi:outer membrane protein assembly factor BamB
MVSSGGRLFCICDETLACADGAVPSKWSLIARDAFSGVLLWKRPIREWGSGAFSGTPNTGGGGVVGRFTMPPNVSKRLVAVGDTVFVTLGPAAPITALDAATGEQKQVYTGTAGADEILCTGDRLVVSINPPMERRPESVDSRSTPPPAPGKRVRAIDVETGETLWERGPFEAVRASISQDPFGRIELAAGDGRALLLTSRSIVCLELDSGDVAWQVERPKLPEQAVRQIGFAGMYEFRLSVMVYHDGVVLLAQPEPNTHHTYHTMPGTLYAFDAANGRLLWKRSYGGWGHCTPPDVFVADGAVWTHVDAQTDYGHVWRNGLRAKDSSNVDYRIQALDLRTGRTIREVSTRDIFNVGHHHRCYRNRMTSQFLLSCRRGVEFVDLDDGDNYQNHWVRSGCLLGYLPCNGLLYVTPHPCSCYINAKLVGFNALAASMAQKSADVDRRAPRLHRGPVYEGIELRDAPSAAADDWPTYRHDPQRSGATEAYLGPELIRVWQTQLGTVPGAPVAAGGKVLVAGGDDHSIHALDAESGKVLWTYTTGARVDSPPTLYRGLALFGSRDGRVYCLRIADGELVWRFDAAPTRRLVTAFGQLESAWPVPGSVLIDEGRCWFAAGRASHLDGGIRLYALDPRTGEILHEETLSSVDPETNKIPVETSAQQMHGLLNDIPASDGADVFIRQMQVASSGGKAGLRLYSSGGFLDPSWFNRTFWHAGRVRTSGLMVLGDGVAYGMEVYESRSRETVFRPGGNAYRLRCISLRPTKSKPADKAAARRRRRHGQKPEWEVRTGIRVTAMARAGERLFSAGSPDIVDPDDPHGAWEGRKGGRLAVFAAADGKKLAEYRLAAPPAWDAMAVAEGRLLLSTRDGSVVCFAGEK